MDGIRLTTHFQYDILIKDFYAIFHVLWWSDDEDQCNS